MARRPDDTSVRPSLRKNDDFAEVRDVPVPGNRFPFSNQRVSIPSTGRGNKAVSNAHVRATFASMRPNSSAGANTRNK